MIIPGRIWVAGIAMSLNSLLDALFGLMGLWSLPASCGNGEAGCRLPVAEAGGRRTINFTSSGVFFLQPRDADSSAKDKLRRTQICLGTIFPCMTHSLHAKSWTNHPGHVSAGF